MDRVRNDIPIPPRSDASTQTDNRKSPTAMPKVEDTFSASPPTVVKKAPPVKDPRPLTGAQKGVLGGLLAAGATLSATVFAAAGQFVLSQAYFATNNEPMGREVYSRIDDTSTYGFLATGAALVISAAFGMKVLVDMWKGYKAPKN